MKPVLFLTALGVLPTLHAAETPEETLRRFADSLWRQQSAAYTMETVIVGDASAAAKRSSTIKSLFLLQKPDRFYQRLERAGELLIERVSDGEQRWQWLHEEKRSADIYQERTEPLGQRMSTLPMTLQLFFNPSLTILDPEFLARYETSILVTPAYTPVVRETGRIMLGNISARTYSVEVKGGFGEWPLVVDDEDWPGGTSDISAKGAEIAIGESGGVFAYRNSDSLKGLWLVCAPTQVAPEEAARMFARRPPADLKPRITPTRIIQLGDRPKDFTLQDLYGKDVNFYSTVHSHKATLLISIPPECLGCHIESVWAQKLHELYRDKGLAVLIVTGLSRASTINSSFAKRYGGHLADTNRGTSPEWESFLGLYRHFKRIFAPAATVRAETMEYPVLVDTTWDAINRPVGEVRAEMNGYYGKVNDLIFDSHGRLVYLSGPRLAFGGPTKAFNDTLRHLGVIDGTPAAVTTTP